MDASFVKRLWHLLRATYVMLLRKGLSKHKLLVNLDLLLKRSKLAGKAIGNFLIHHHNHRNAVGADACSAFSCRSITIDPSLAFYEYSKDFEFSCSNTPSYPSFFLPACQRRHHGLDFGYDADVAAAMVRGLETLSAEMAIAPDDADSTTATPSPVLLSWRNQAGVRRLRVTDSPFPVIREGKDDGGKVDRRAEEFIKEFYEQLRLQKSVPGKPEDGGRRRKTA
ncbi:uncharacterized protein LOC122017278 [Zingiber officinale]|uniref:Avr9/Cf-9 rapidly elicited protein 146 n=1 Tax=Zingiber officinale TaxID=94328 RepID=A0A8J5FA07_ZINOF|nr:uncharacterized protein LOC122017278 [Zingiber officinale]KAG6483329.1 hypothetical protein ZIOFF_059973 [Zingiber officinale]